MTFIISSDRISVRATTHQRASEPHNLKSTVETTRLMLFLLIFEACRPCMNEEKW